MPFLSMVRSAAWLTRRRTQRFSFSTQKRRLCRLGRNRRLVRLFAWETLFPVIGRLPVTSHTRAMMLAPNSAKPALYHEPGALLKVFRGAGQPSRRPGAPGETRILRFSKG